MKKLFYVLIAFSVLSACSAGETDKTSPVHESEELNFKKDKTADTITVTDTIQH